MLRPRPTCAACGSAVVLVRQTGGRLIACPTCHPELGRAGIPDSAPMQNRATRGWAWAVARVVALLLALWSLMPRRERAPGRY